MIATVKKTPWTARKHDIAAKLQSFGKSRVQHFNPWIVNNTVAPDASGASPWEKARESEDEAGNRGKPHSHGFCVDAEFCERHVVSPWLSLKAGIICGDNRRE